MKKMFTFSYNLVIRRIFCHAPKWTRYNSNGAQQIFNGGLFDKSYLKYNPDVKNSGVDPLIHYLKFGGFEGYNPWENFESQFYLEQKPGNC